MRTVELYQFIVVLFGASGLDVVNTYEQSYCLGSAYCNLIKGDIASESEKYEKNSAKYYADAKTSIEKYNQFKSKNDDSINKSCNETLFLCLDETVKMVIEGLGYPNNSAQHCGFSSYSKDIFRCENIKKWPVDVRQALPMEDQICQSTCRFDRSNYTLSNGKTLYSESEQLNMDGILPPDVVQSSVYIESKNSRVLSPWMSGFEDSSNGSDWGPVNICTDKWWVVEVNKNNEKHSGPMYTTHTDCIRMLDRPEEYPYDWIGYWYHLRSIPKISEDIMGPSEFEECRLLVKNTSAQAFVIGIRLERMPFIIGKYTTALKALHYICADGQHGVRKYINNKKPDFNSPNVDKEMLCPNGTAMCALQTKYVEDKTGSAFDGNRRYVVLNIRIACCEGDSSKGRHVNFAVVKENPMTTTTATTTTTITTTPTTLKPPTQANEIFDLQKIQTYVFWDDDAVHNGIITRFNEYYSPSFVPNQDVWSTSKCPNGTFLNGFSIKDSKACYYQGIRVMEINLRCGKADGTETIDLGTYNSTLKYNHTLQDNKLLYNSTCANGHYNNMELTYYVDKIKTYMVRAWAFGMKCSESSSIGPHKHIINPLSDRKINVINYNEVKSISQCGNGMGLCGIQRKLIHDGRGTFEGLFMKIICCNV